MQNKEIQFASRPARMPTLENFQFVDAEVPHPNDGEVLVRMLYISVDPYLRGRMREGRSYVPPFEVGQVIESRSEEHTSELQSRLHIVCRLLLEKKNKHKTYIASLVRTLSG